ncbi:hypothetical protein NK718_12610 [Alsobacter sp. SYSU M60028]|uniref:DUF748 domain-containing protein n=1 Tax=Alsobacter ponti TaxID=2962936 RepID=A0ABT1LCY0_9HYPH|nr:hypothetical protein [Alsobacter ponti]MCP8939359.1 hypothetical protein [Alsobacter ponti]
MTPALRFLGLAAGASALVLAASAGLERSVRGDVDALLARLAPDASVTRDAVAVDPWSGRVRVEGLRFALPGGTQVTIGAVTLLADTSLLGRALAAETVALENVSIVSGPVTVEMPRLQASGSSASRAQWLELFDKASATPLSRRLAALSAESVSAPEIVIRSTLAEASSRVVYRDLRVSGLADGVVRSLALSGGSQEATASGKALAQGGFGPVSISQLDLVQLARFYFEAAGPEDRAAKPVYASFSAESFTWSDAMGARSTVRLVTGKDFRVRPGRAPLLPLITDMAANKPDAMDAAERGRLMGAVADMLDGIEIGTNELIDFEISTPAGNDQITVRIPRVALNGAGPGRPSALQIDRFELRDKDNSVRIGSVSHTGWSYNPLIEALRKLAATGDLDPDAIDPRSFLPDFGSLVIRDVEVDAADPTLFSKDRFRIGVKSVELSASEPVNHVPTAGRFAVDRVTMAVPPKPEADGLKELVGLGYKDLDLSAALDSRWIAATNEFSLNQAQVQGVNMGSVSLTALLGNVTKDVFDADATMAQLAVMAATFREARLSIENKGLFERIVDREAKKQKKSPEQFRKELGSMAQMAAPMMLGNAKAGATIGAAVARFVTKPTRLTITAKARSTGGVGALELMQSGGDPGQILDLIDVTASND